MFEKAPVSNPSLRPNNFDLIRLLAAAQVIYIHAVGRTGLFETAPAWAMRLLDIILAFPGVAVFFVVSGFLVSKSYERSCENPGIYFQHRALRIFPALIFCLLVTLGVLYFFGFLTPEVLGSATFWGWLAGQASFVQFYNPEFFRDFGVGVVNPALWTISVELQFYFILPIFYALVFPPSRPSKSGKLVFWLSFAASFAVFCFVDQGMNRTEGFGGAGMLTKLLFVSLAPHWWMFALGIVMQRNFSKIRTWIEGKFLVYFLAYSLFALLRQGFLGRDSAIPELYYLGYLPERILMALMVVSGAFSARRLSGMLLRGTDISYGVYLYHCLVINVFIELGWMDSMRSVAGVYAGAVALGLLSWFSLEKRALSLKRRRPAPRPKAESSLQLLPPLPVAQPTGMQPFNRKN